MDFVGISGKFDTMKETESVKIDKKIIADAKKVKQDTGVPIGTQFEKAWEQAYKRLPENLTTEGK